MNGEAGGMLWLMIDVGLVLVLAGALIYGMVQWSRWKQNPKQAAARDAKTRELFDKR